MTNEVALVKPRLPYKEAFKQKYELTEERFKVLIDAIYPSAKSIDSVIMVLEYCQSRKLDPFKRPVHIVPVWNSSVGRTVETIWPGINELRITAVRTKEYAGCDQAEFGDSIQGAKFEGTIKNNKGQWEKVEAKVNYPDWCRLTVYKLIQGQRVAFEGPKIYWLESYGKQQQSIVPNKKWQESPSYMLEKCAEAAALRRAFPEELGNDYTAEEMEGQIIDDGGLVIENEPEERPEMNDDGSEYEFDLYDQYGEKIDIALSSKDWCTRIIELIDEIAIDVALQELKGNNQDGFNLLNEEDQKLVNDHYSDRMAEIKNPDEPDIGPEPPPADSEHEGAV